MLNHISESLVALRFEWILALGAIFILIAGLISKNIRIIQGLFVSVLVLALIFLQPVSGEKVLFGGAFILDGLSWYVKMLVTLIIIWIVLFPPSRKHEPEFYFLVLCTMLGSVLMLGAADLLTIYVVVELTSFCSYILTNFQFSKKSFEAGIKYLVFGGVSSALGLYGASLIYGFQGTISLSEMDFLSTSRPELLDIGMLLFLGSILFKVSVIPFHIWTPTTYEQAPTDAVLVLSVAPKIAGFVLLHRVLIVFHVQETYWLYVLMAGLGILTIALGTLGALKQTNLKRLIAYGAIAHSGFLLAAVLIPMESGLMSFVIYSTIYAVMSLGIFFIISVFDEMGIEEVKELSGLSRKSPYFGALLVVVVIALAGLPPTAGFTVKFYLFAVLWDWYQRLADPVILTYLVVAILSVVFSLFFYLKLPFFYFLKEGSRFEGTKIQVSSQIVATIFTVALLWIFLTPEILNKIAMNINFLNW